MMVILLFSWAVPIQAATTTGRLGIETGTVTVNNPTVGETYKIYRLFELASFSDENTKAGHHDNEAYSYVIDSTSAWYTFLTTYGPDGAGSSTPYAVLSTSTDTTKNAAAYFTIEADAVTINHVSTYHTISPTTKFSNAYDITASNYQTQDYTAENYSNVQDFAQEALKYATAESSQVPAAAAAINPTSESETVSWTNLPLGYYLVSTTMGSLASLDTTNTTATIYDKSEAPTLAKYVLKKGATTNGTATYSDLVDTSTNWVSDTDADINDYVQFKSIITAKQGARNYVIHDVMEEGFTYVNESKNEATNEYADSTIVSSGNYDYTTKVYLLRGDATIYQIPASVASGTSIDSTAATSEITNWVLTSTGLSDGCDFEISFSDADGEDYGNDAVRFAVKPVSADTYSWIDIKDDDKIVITYWAKLNTSAVIYGGYGDQETVDSTKTNVVAHNNTKLSSQIGRSHSIADQRNTNQTVLTYGDAQNTTWANATVTTYQFDIVKTKDSATDSYDLLAGARFSLYKATTTAVTGAKSFTINNTTYYIDPSNALVFKTPTNNEYQYAGDSTAAASAGTTVNQLTSTAAHEIQLEGLEAGPYILIEDEAPAGYNKLNNPIVVTVGNGKNEGQIIIFAINDKGKTSQSVVQWHATIRSTTNGETTTYQYEKYTTGGVHVVNKAGTVLPSTGGIGTTIFYLIGGVLIAGAAVLIVIRRRRV